MNTELIEEMQQQLDKGNVQDAKTIANEIQKNEQKINQHGKKSRRHCKKECCSILEQIQTKEPADLNALANEYSAFEFSGLSHKGQII